MRATRREANSIAAGASVLGWLFCHTLGGESKERGDTENNGKHGFNKTRRHLTTNTGHRRHWAFQTKGNQMRRTETGGEQSKHRWRLMETNEDRNRKTKYGHERRGYT